MVLSNKQIDSFKKNGFIILDNAFDEADTKAFEHTARRTARFLIEKSKSEHPDFPEIEPGQELNMGIMALENTDHKYIADYSDFIDKTPEIYRLSSTPLLHQASMQLLGLSDDAPTYVTNCAFILAIPSDREYSYGWHKDTFYTLPDSRYIQMWAPLIETSSTDLGTLEVCVGSHVVGAKEQHAVDGVPNRHRYRVDIEAVEKYPKMHVDMTVGQVLLFDAGLAHRSGLNRSKRARHSIVSVYHQLENQKIRPLKSHQFQGKSMEEYFTEICGVIRTVDDDDKHFSSGDITG